MLVVFICIALIHLIRILRDFADVSSSVKETTEKMHENINKIVDKVTVAADQISEYVVKPFSLIQYLTEKVKPMMEMLQKKGEEWGYIVDEGEEEEKPKKKKRWGKKK